MFKVLSNEWSESRRKDQVDKFRNYHPTTDNDLQEPRNAVRKPCYIHREKAKEPDIVVDRLSVSNFWPTSSPTMATASTLISTLVSTKSSSTSVSTLKPRSTSTFTPTFSVQPST